MEDNKKLPPYDKIYTFDQLIDHIPVWVHLFIGSFCFCPIGDPWHDATVSSDFIVRLSLSQDNLIADFNGHRCTDLVINNNVDPTVAKVQELARAFRRVDGRVQIYKTHALPTPLPQPDPFTPQSISPSVANTPPSIFPASITSATGLTSTAQNVKWPRLPIARMRVSRG
ncbi:hypothetical protein BOTBODRAFT_171584 [Botryobasidium botryosum FD-172 SS1]|uniref:Uncharacterized protein n=1 Tax=Botryobasidium botryosum (strain FD-172 SS1) TaxID=930990 RepID=A0A067MT63_BOTB1|nr:hypothetical protein BOTBODRAFT_171584 [Botryobasidium botryosum FD-172 SS1]